MDIYNSEAVQRVWQRVLQQPQEGIPEETLESWIADAMAAYRSYLAMGQQRKQLGRMFRAMAADEAAQVRRLQAMRWLTNGRKDKILSGSAEGKRSFATALRSRYEAEQAAVMQFQAAAKQYPRQQAMLQAMADNAKQHCNMLQRAAEGLF